MGVSDSALVPNDQPVIGKHAHHLARRTRSTTLRPAPTRTLYALAEFVDNATQNFFTHAQRLADADGEALLDIDITYGTRGADKVLRITDNAHGMDLDELTRAMKISAPPPDKSGRSEFGMGMKTAACWFGSRWTVDTTQAWQRQGVHRRPSTSRSLPDPGQHPRGARNVQRFARSRHHVHDRGPRKPIVGRQIEKIRKTLTSMYRQTSTRAPSRSPGTDRPPRVHDAAAVDA